ncbi:MAG TPA: hypothetical protein VMW27_07200 [Thermoanaerobaculia bacterium]|nr:hypothetical protein [Thermoanaerobaculia bacterium]
MTLLLTSTALGMGLQLDDFVLKALLTGKPGVGVAPWDAFAFFPEGSPRLPVQRELGELPWWTAPDLRLAFFRPLSSLSHWLDFQLWPDSPVLMHVHNLAWFALLVFLAGWIYRGVLPEPWVAGLAMLLFAVDDVHGQAAGWISSRNTLLSACFGFLAIALHDRWRRGWRPGVVLAPAAFLAGLCCGEGATGALGYLLGHALFLDPAPGWKRLRGLVPYGFCLVLWRAVYDAGGFGVEKSGFYLDPLRETAAFLRLLPERFGLLFLTQWGFPPTEFVTASGGERSARVLALAGFLLFLLLAWRMGPLLRRDTRARFWATGSLLSMIPIAGTIPSTRLLLFTGLGGMGLLAQWLASVPRRRIDRAVAAVLVIIHLVLAPLLLPVMTYALAIPGQASLHAVSSLPPDSEIQGRDVVIVNSPDFLFFVGYDAPLRYLEDRPRPAHLRALATGLVPLTVSRPDARTLRIDSEVGFPAGLADPVYRGPTAPLRPGESIALPGMTVEIRAVGEDGRARSADFRFATPFESLVWLRWDGGVYRPFQPPGVGETITLPPARLPF